VHDVKSEVATWSGRSMKFMAVLVVALMVASAFIMLAPAVKAPASAPVAEKAPASVLAEPLNRQVTYTVSNLGESCVKDSRDVDGARGVHSTPGLSEWWTQRKILYSDTIMHNSYPYWVAYNPESSYNSYTGVMHLAYGTYGFYRLTMNAKDISNVATGPGMDPLYVPVLGSLAADGGTLQLNWHITYMTAEDVAGVQAGTSFANTYYGINPDDVNFQGSYANEGWYIEQKGTMTFDVAAAQKFLGLPGTASLIDEFNYANRREGTGANPPGLLNKSWADHYMAEGTSNGIYDIISAYDFSLNAGPVIYGLMVDPSSTPTSLKLRMWGYSWGVEVLMMRYLDVQGLQKDFQGWSEDYYFNATITSDRAQIQTRSTTAYHMTTWKDPNYWGAAWMLEAQHYDYNDVVTTYWESRFTPYMAYRGYTPMRTMWEPGTIASYGVLCAYVNAPHVWNLAAGESLIVKLPTQQTMGYMPYKGTVIDTFPKQGGGNDAKAVEMATHEQWGELVLGTGTFPTSIYSASYYNPTTKTLTFNGPTNWDRNANKNGYPEINETGSPMFMFDISPVSEYNLSLPIMAYYSIGVPYTLTVTARDLAGATVATNFTVNLVGSAGVTLGATSHLFTPGDAGVWTTTVTFTAAGKQTISAADSRFSLDVTGFRALPVDCKKVDLKQGWNLVSVPRLGFGYKASLLGLLTGDVVVGYNSAAQSYNRSYTVGVSPAFKNFWMLPSECYWVYAQTAEQLYLQGTVPSGTQTRAITVPAGGGWFLFGLASLTTTYKASNTPAWYSGGSVSVVAAYESGVYRTWNPGAPPFKDFFLAPGAGYWIYVTASGTISYTA
jgi:hypothetical protein